MIYSLLIGYWVYGLIIHYVARELIQTPWYPLYGDVRYDNKREGFTLFALVGHFLNPLTIIIGPVVFTTYTILDLIAQIGIPIFRYFRNALDIPVSDLWKKPKVKDNWADEYYDWLKPNND